MWPSLEAALAEAEASAGETDAALRRLNDALAGLEATENRWCEAEMHRIHAEILLKRDPADEALVTPGEWERAPLIELSGRSTVPIPVEVVSPELAGRVWGFR